MDYVVYKARQGAYQRYVDEQKECVFEEVPRWNDPTPWLVFRQKRH